MATVVLLSFFHLTISGKGSQCPWLNSQVLHVLKLLVAHWLKISGWDHLNQEEFRRPLYLRHAIMMDCTRGHNGGDNTWLDLKSSPSFQNAYLLEASFLWERMGHFCFLGWSHCPGSSWHLGVLLYFPGLSRKCVWEELSDFSSVDKVYMSPH